MSEDQPAAGYAFDLPHRACVDEVTGETINASGGWYMSP